VFFVSAPKAKKAMYGIVFWSLTPQETKQAI
jgi:hypothetical protein